MAELVALGPAGLRVPPIGCGIMSVAYYGSGDAGADEASQLAAIDELVARSAPHPAFLDTAFIYANAHLTSEEVVGKAVAKHGRERFVIATKFGLLPGGQPPCSSREVIHAQFAESCRRLGTRPDLLYQHRQDPARPVEEVVADLAALVAAGEVKYIGLSEVTADELRRAHAVHPITAVQMEWSLAERGVEASGLLQACRELGVGIVAYSPLARGILTAAPPDTGALPACDLRKAGDRYPRFADGALQANVAKAASLRALAARKGCTPAQLALAWLLAKGRALGVSVVPIPGSKTPARVAENMGAAAVAAALSDAELAEIEALDVAAVGARYAASMMPWTAQGRLQQAHEAEAQTAGAGSS